MPNASIDGYSRISLDAYRNLTEQVYGLYVESATQMGDLSLVAKMFRSRQRGLVYGSRLVSITPVGARPTKLNWR